MSDITRAVENKLLEQAMVHLDVDKLVKQLVPILEKTVFNTIHERIKNYDVSDNDNVTDMLDKYAYDVIKKHFKVKK